MQRTLFLAFVLAVGNLHAQTIILKCTDGQGRVVYTTEACARGQSLKDVKAYAPVRDDPVARERLRDIERQQDARDRTARAERSQPVFYVAPMPTERDRRKHDCAIARREADEARGKGHTSSYLIALDKAATDACFGL